MRLISIKIRQINKAYITYFTAGVASPKRQMAKLIYLLEKIFIVC